MPEFASTRCGKGEPLVLLHGLGSSRQAWSPVLPALAKRFDVIALDLPGFGQTAPLPAGTEPTPQALAFAVAVALDDLGVHRPHLAGNSLGGWVALELAKIRPVRSITLLSPAGLWRHHTPLYCRASLRLSRWAAGHATRLLTRLVAHSVGRIIVLGQTHAHPSRMTPGQAGDVIRAMGACPGFDDTLRATANRRYLPDHPIQAPVTVAFGTRDLLLLPFQSRQLGALPAETTTARLPGCGHVPMSDNPAAVADLIRRFAADAGTPTACSPIDRRPHRTTNRANRDTARP
jgi:pimeloyl-ACP methyl ester carboxylesterase